MNFFDPFTWYEEEEKKRQETMKLNEISIINRELQSLLHKVIHHIDISKYEEFEQQLVYQYRVVNSNLQHLSWVNNFESDEVALAQALFILHITNNETIEEIDYILYRLEQLMNQLSQIDYNLYIKYQEAKR